LLDVQRFQTREMPSLLSLQPMRFEHGPSLSMGQQLRRLLEQEVFLVAFDLRLARYLHDDDLYGL
jgi:hypothetical protein